MLVGAHIDDRSHTARAPGADDDGSGCATLLWTARHFAVRRFARTVRFVSFGGEEAGFLGSAAYALDARRRGDKLTAVVIADMFGVDRGSHVVAVHTRPLSNGKGAQRDL